MNNPKCKACGWTLANAGSTGTCPQCDSEISYARVTVQPVWMQALNGIERLGERVRQLEDQVLGEVRTEQVVGRLQEQVTGADPLCPRCVSILKDRMGIRDPLARSAEHWWASELAKLSQCQSWPQLRAGIIAASNKVLNLTKLMEEEERL